jgi:hypothetical protein
MSWSVESIADIRTEYLFPQIVHFLAPDKSSINKLFQ